MTFDFGRLRRGEQIAGGGGLLLFIALFFFKWYGASISFGGGEVFSASVNGWHGHSVLRWLMLLVILAAVALVVATATQSTPALPISIAPVLTAIALLTTVLLAYRVLLNEPGPNDVIDVRIGAYVGLIASALVTYGGYLTMRIEGGPASPTPVQVRRVSE